MLVDFALFYLLVICYIIIAYTLFNYRSIFELVSRIKGYLLLNHSARYALKCLCLTNLTASQEYPYEWRR